MTFFSVLGALATGYLISCTAGYIMTSTVFFVLLLAIRQYSNGYFAPIFDKKRDCFRIAFLWPKFIIWDVVIKGILAKGKK